MQNDGDTRTLSRFAGARTKQYRWLVERVEGAEMVLLARCPSEREARRMAEYFGGNVTVRCDGGTIR